MSDLSGSQPPGWYYAQGDPAGTHRYWDGTQWQGGPQAASGVAGQAAPAQGLMATPAAAGSRFVAFLVDTGISIAISMVLLFITAIGGSISDVLGTLMTVVWYFSLFAWFLYNHVYLLGSTGQSIGKRTQDIKLVSSGSGETVGIGMAFVRYLVQSVSWSLCFFPGLVDAIFVAVKDDHRRFTDNILNMQVVEA